MKIVDISYEDVRATHQDIEHLLIKNPYRQYNEELDAQLSYDKLYYLDNGIMYPLLKSIAVCLPDEDNIRYYYKTSDGSMN
jgi:hypothetical protein